jgi:hypothetical protein
VWLPSTSSRPGARAVCGGAKPKPRRKTKPTLASKVRRIEGKVQRGKVKSLRSRKFDD